MVRRTHIIVVAAGSGSRFGGDLPKQFCELSGKPVLVHAIEAFRRALPLADITLVLSRWGEEYWRDYCERTGYVSPPVVIGGDTRARSVCNALEALALTHIADDDIVLVHDGARPLVSAAVIHRVAGAVDELCGAVPAVMPVDSLRLVSDSGSRTVDRAVYRAVQTPQGFPFGLLYDAYRHALLADGTFTDDASVYEAARGEVRLVPGSPLNLKITNPDDIAIASVLARRQAEDI